MTWTLAVFYAALSVLAYFAMAGRTPTRRLFSAIGIISVQIAALVWIQIIARALGSQSKHGSYSTGVGELYLAIRPILFFNVAVCLALVLIFLAALSGKEGSQRVNESGVTPGPRGVGSQISERGEGAGPNPMLNDALGFVVLGPAVTLAATLCIFVARQ